MDSANRITTLQNLLCGSKYEGYWSSSMKWMDGYGTYTFPDGSTYQGYFKSGKFHGRGTVFLAKPYNFVIKGTFVHGSVESIDYMCFEDGLHVTASLHGFQMDFSGWFYCTKGDRRYMREHSGGILPVGPTTFLSANTPDRPLSEGFYDVGEGIYCSKNYFISDRPPPFPAMRLICVEELPFIKNCRQGRDNVSIPINLHRKIVKRNVSNEAFSLENKCCKKPQCNFGRVCDSRDMDEARSLINDNISTENECSSFTISSLHRESYEVIEYDDVVIDDLFVPTKSGKFFVMEPSSSLSDTTTESKPPKSLTTVSKTVNVTINKLGNKEMVSSSYLTTQEMNFIVGTKYKGHWANDLIRMEGFGEYVFPDGSTYRGDFKKGKFSGNGVIYLAHPYNFEIKGEFINGIITKIIEMRFSDGLVVDADLDGTSLNFDRWAYCNGVTRTFACEVFDGLRPVGPTAHLTPNKSASKLHVNHFDTIEGVFDAKTGLVHSRPPPFTRTNFIQCEKDRNLITDNYRTTTDSKVKIKLEVCEKILQINLDNEGNLAESGYCSCVTKNDRTRLFPQLDKMGDKSSEKVFNLWDMHSPSSSEGASFSAESLIENVTQRLNLTEDCEIINHNLIECKKEDEKEKEKDKEKMQKNCI
uniref:MORN repeat-containing protein 5 n=1 Tax=Glossina pallidipes TaxID=7398 RepID=A0A1A9ZKI6_GLOPL